MNATFINGYDGWSFLMLGKSHLADQMLRNRPDPLRHRAHAGRLALGRHRPPKRRPSHGLSLGPQHGQGGVQGGLESPEGQHHAGAARSGLPGNEHPRRRLTPISAPERPTVFVWLVYGTLSQSMPCPKTDRLTLALRWPLDAGPGGRYRESRWPALGLLITTYPSPRAIRGASIRDRRSRAGGRRGGWIY